MTLTSHRRYCLVELVYALDTVRDCYDLELHNNPSELLSSEDVCLIDFVRRTSTVARIIIDQDGEKGRVRAQLVPPTPQEARRLDEALRRRREKAAQEMTTNEKPGAKKATAPIRQPDVPDDDDEEYRDTALDHPQPVPIPTHPRPSRTSGAAR